MNLLINRSVKEFLIRLVLILVIGSAASQVLAYANAVQFKNYMVMHDYEVAGYLSQAHPELALKIQAAFTADKDSAHFEAGKALLGRSEYKKSTKLYLIPYANMFYKASIAENLMFSFLLGLAVLLAAFLFLKSHFNSIDRYSDDINRIMKGDISTKLEDNYEGSLPKLAASINIMTSSLYAHIEKEKQNRVFMKNILENVSHQLKTPLSALTMYNEIMREENTHNEVISKFLEKSGNELERMQTLIASLLKLARLDAGIIELNRKNYILKDITEQAVESFETRLLKEQKTFEVEAKGNISYYCDKEWMLEALSNLFKNAVEHTNTGNHIKVLIEETPLLVKIIVEDNGEGIHPKDINHIFKRFYRSKFSQSKQGTGIGLTLAKTVIEMHGGFISVESPVGKGTKFTVHLPIPI